MGLNFDSFSAKFGNMFILQLWVTKILHFFSGTETWILSTRFEENMFDLHFLAQLKISGAETWLLRIIWKKHILSSTLGPTLENHIWGWSLDTFTKFEQDIVYLQLWAPLKIKIFAGVQTGILCVKVWKETNLSSALGPTKNWSSWWGPNW